MSDLPAAVIEKMNGELAPAVRAEIKSVISSYHADYEQRRSDYFQYTNDFDDVPGTPRWDAEMYDRDAQNPESLKWQDHFSGNESWTGLRTYQDEIYDGIYSILRNFIIEGLKKDERDCFERDSSGEFHEWAIEVIDGYLDCPSPLPDCM